MVGRRGCRLSAFPAGTFSPARLERVGDYLRNEIATGKIPGAIILIQQHGQPVYFEKLGVIDVATRRPMSEDAIFRLYSMSKPITSVAAMMLVEDGKLALDDPLSKYIPAFAKVEVGVEKRDAEGGSSWHASPLNRPITIEDLLRHTSGLTYGFYGDSAVRKLYANSDLFDGRFRQCANLPNASPGCRSPNSRERCGITATRPTCSAASSRWYRENRCFSSRRSVCSIRSE